MRIHISHEAAWIHGHKPYTQPNHTRWNTILDKIAGMTLEVETAWLFDDQFNTPPIPDVSESGLRVFAGIVTQIDDDARIGRKRCQGCGRPADLSVETCPYKHHYPDDYGWQIFGPQTWRYFLATLDTTTKLSYEMSKTGLIRPEPLSIPWQKLVQQHIPDAQHIKAERRYGVRPTHWQEGEDWVWTFASHEPWAGAACQSLIAAANAALEGHGLERCIRLWPHWDMLT